MNESKIKVLIVDDHEGMRKLVHMALRAPHYDFYEAEQADEALELLKTVQPDIIISDVMMPGMDGFDFCQRVRENPDTAHAFICMLTALDRGQDRRRAEEVGANAFLTKPFSIHDLAKTVNEGVQTHVTRV